MPTYRFQCQHCYGEFEIWRSIHDNSPITHHSSLTPDVENICNGEVVQVITRVATYGVGDRGAQTRYVDASEKQLSLDRPAYKRFRDEGHQPRHLKGAHKLEALAANDWEVKTGGLVSVPADRELEINEMMADAATGDWSPIEEVHRRKAKA